MRKKDKTVETTEKVILDIDAFEDADEEELELATDDTDDDPVEIEIEGAVDDTEDEEDDDADFVEYDYEDDELEEEDVEELKDVKADEAREENDEMSQKKAKKDKKKSKKKSKKKTGKKTGNKALKGFLITIGVLAGIYLAVAAVFTQFSFYDTKINGVEFSLSTEGAIDEYFANHVGTYDLTIHTNDGKTEVIKGTDISLSYNEGSGMKDLFIAQNPLLWPKMFFGTTEHEAKLSVSYDEALLDGIVGGFGFMDPTTFTEPIDAYLGVVNGVMEVIPEVYGTKLDQEVTKDAIADYIDRQERELILTEEACYVPPAILSTSEDLQAKAELMTPYLTGTITYAEGEVIDAARIASWLVVNENNEVSINQEAVVAYVAEVAGRRNTVGQARTFTTPTGKQATVSGGTYGWTINQEAEVQQIIAEINAKVPVSREFNYYTRAHSYTGSDWGPTYVLVDLTEQYMWFIQENNVTFEAPVVTGMKNDPKLATPQGVYKVDYKQEDRVLKGEIQPDGTREYETPVDYWVHVHSGIGFHDATWQSSFGGSRYVTNGSHGCVNMSLSNARTFYGMIWSGVPVVFTY